MKFRRFKVPRRMAADPIFQVRLQQHRSSTSAELKLRVVNTSETLAFDVFQDGNVPVLAL